MIRNYSGATCETAQSLFIGAGAFFKNYNFETDTYDKAMAAGKCLGATQGGGTFSAIPTMAETKIDGADPIPRIEGWVVQMSAQIIELKPDTIALALGTGVVTQKNETYWSIKAQRHISPEHYLENITYVGTVSGSSEPFVIQIFNAISQAGLTLTTNGTVGSPIKVEFTSRIDVCKNPEFLEYVPFEFFFPKRLESVKLNPVNDDDTAVTGTGVPGATVYVTGGTIPENTSCIVEANKEWSVAIPKQNVGTMITAWQEMSGKKSLTVSTIVKIQGGT